ncbi:uncharacterized protein BO80DRAFT_424916 [Aspergillus ibericus CBS 121593]|uniref:Uncharacterized protein n=1 Tax=Aspergillus ibericus CBS 121593 TaxID=1448316 RepID=A0A395H0K8_9EURO|nr:hypothetical protein BO80DRAFT_424916 [Aspergillus ibericus CBS 121593]RAL01367.1 hypothetical protein BO80DRAFT_424916 [Aspergillus ibericus CBS 121593]
MPLPIPLLLMLLKPHHLHPRDIPPPTTRQRALHPPPTTQLPNPAPSTPGFIHDRHEKAVSDDRGDVYSGKSGEAAARGGGCEEVL